MNRKFYKEISNWYFWALGQVEFPADAEPKKEIRNSINVIRLITRLIFVWFLKEKGLVPDKLFNETEMGKILNKIDKTGSTYYKAILQMKIPDELFFGEERLVDLSEEYGNQKKV